MFCLYMSAFLYTSFSVQIFIYNHASFRIPFLREATFHGLPSCVSDKLGCNADENLLLNIALRYKIVLQLVN